VWWLKHLDRGQNPPDTGLAFFAYGVYTIAIQNNFVVMDYRDAEYQDGYGDGFGTDYENPDLKIFYDADSGYFYKDYNLTQRIYASIAIWEDGRKSSGPKIPVTVTNSFGAGEITIGTAAEESPYQQKWLADAGVSIGAVSPQTVNGLIYTFDNWSDAGDQTHVVTPTLDDFGTFSFTANFAVSGPVPVTGLAVGGSNGNPVHISWDVHPNSGVNYYIYRKVKHNGVMGQEEFVATVSHETDSYDDDTWFVIGYSIDHLFYDARAHHESTSTFATAQWEGGIYGESILKIGRDLKEFPSDEMPAVGEFSLSAHPNPFNPSTTIHYSLPNRSPVTLRVFNTLGQEVAQLVNDGMDAGYHEVRFDAASGLSSGVYLYRIQAGDFVQTKRLLLLR
jgi:hypothetical protein